MCGWGRGGSDCERQMTESDKTSTEVWSHYSPAEVVLLLSSVLVGTLQRLLRVTEGGGVKMYGLNNIIHTS